MGYLEEPNFVKKIREEQTEYWKGDYRDYDEKARKKLIEQNKQLKKKDKLILKIVQRPEYVISELLQNADDAEAKCVDINIKLLSKEAAYKCLIFEHNGKDFTEENFRALCSIGMSSKDTIETTGCRGIGFKSVFSINNRVYLQTPTISVRFEVKNDCDECTIPLWTNKEPINCTQITIPLVNNVELVHNSLKIWKESPMSLLFFNNIETLNIDGTTHSIIHGQNGPVKNSEWIQFTTRDSSKNLLKISYKMQLPRYIYNEICSDRGLESDPEDNQDKISNAKVELIFGINNSDNLIFSTLPTNQHTIFPCAINASFILTPERDKLKTPSYIENDVEESRKPNTNAWVFEQIGDIIIQSFREWIGNSSLDISERIKSYSLLPTLEPKYDYDDIAFKKIKNYISCNPKILIDIDGNLQRKCVYIPDLFYRIWDNDTIKSNFAMNSIPVLSEESSKIIEDISSIFKIYDISIVEYCDYIPMFRSGNLPTPASMDKIIDLFIHIISRTLEYDSLKIIPGYNKNRLYSAKEIILPYPKMDKLPEVFKDMIERNSVFVDLEFLDNVSNNCFNVWNKNISEKVVNYFNNCIHKIRFTSEDNSIIKESSDSEIISYLSNTELNNDDIITLAHLAAYLNVEVPENFPYLSKDGEKRPASSSITYDPENILRNILPPNTAENYVLSDSYMNVSGINSDNWINWLKSPLSKISLPFEVVNINNDYKFKGDIIHKIENIYLEKSRDDNNIWAKILSYLIRNQKDILMTLANGNGESSQWIQIMREKPCVYGDDSKCHKPSDVYISNDKTKLLEKELFINNKYPAKFISLFKKLGVRDTPGYPYEAIKKLELLSDSDSSDINSIQDNFNILNRILLEITSKSILKSIKDHFYQSKLFYNNKGSWVYYNNDIYIGDTDIPNTTSIFGSIAQLDIWDKYLELKNHPDEDDYLNFLTKIESNKLVPDDKIRLVEKILSIYPEKVFESINHWISLNGVWKPLSDFEYYVDKNKIFSARLNAEWLEKIPKLSLIKNSDIKEKLRNSIPNISGIYRVITWKVMDVDTDIPTNDENIPWLECLGKFLTERVPKDHDDYYEIYKLGTIFISTKYRRVNSFNIAPYVGGKRIGIGYENELFWEDKLIYIKSELKVPKLEISLIKSVSNQDGISISVPSIRTLIMTSIGKDKNTIEEYCRAILELNTPDSNAEDNCFDVVPSGESNTYSTNVEVNQKIEDNLEIPTGSEKETESYTIKDPNEEKTFHTNTISRGKENHIPIVQSAIMTDKIHKSLNVVSDYPRNVDDVNTFDPVNNPERREANLIRKFDEAIKEPKYENSRMRSIRRSRYRTFNNRYEQSALKKRHMKERTFLISQYDGFCQICKKGPFDTASLTDSGFNKYFEAVNLIKTENLDQKYAKTEGISGWNSLCLCPDCAAKYKYATKKISNILGDIENIEVESGSTEKIDIHIELDKKDEKISYSPKHFIALKTAISLFKRKDKEFEEIRESLSLQQNDEK